MKKSLFRSFVPYVLLLITILVSVFVLDNYAERVSQEPQVVRIGKVDGQEGSGLMLDQLSSELSLSIRSATGSDSLFTAAVEHFRMKQYHLADEKALQLYSLHPGYPDVLNLLGLIAVRQQKFAQAEIFFLGSLEADPSFNDARINLASLYTDMHREAKAQEQYLEARKMQPNNASIYYNLGLLYMESDQFQAAEQEFIACAELASGVRKSRALCQLGRVQLLLNDTVGARESLNEAILLQPQYELARLQLAMTFSEAGQREAELLKIYRLNQTSFEANLYLGRLYLEQGEPGKSEYHFKKALDIQPYNENLITELGDLLITQGRLEEAELVLAGFSVGDTLPQAYFYQAKIAADRNQVEEAIALYGQAIDRSGNDYPEAYLNMAILYKQMDRIERAIASYQAAIAARPHYSLAYYNLALLYTEIDSLGKAVWCYQRSIAIDSLALKSWYNLGRLYDRRQAFDSSIYAYYMALELDPSYTKAMLAVANAQLRTGNLTDAINQYQRLLSLYPRYSKAYFNLGLAYTRLGDAEKAMETYEKLIEVEPGHVRARINLAILYGRNDRVALSIAVLEDAMDLEMDNPDIRFNLALQYKKLGQNEQAIYHFMKVVEMDPAYRKAYDQLLLLFNEQKDDVNYEIMALRRDRQFNRDADFYETGKRLHELNQYELALEAYEIARENGDDRIWLSYWIGKAYLDLEETQVAKTWFQSVLDRDPEHKFSLYRMGQALELEGRPGLAETYYTALLDLDGEFRIAHKRPLAQQVER